MCVLCMCTYVCHRQACLCGSSARMEISLKCFLAFTGVQCCCLIFRFVFVFVFFCVRHRPCKKKRRCSNRAAKPVCLCPIANDKSRAAVSFPRIAAVSLVLATAVLTQTQTMATPLNPSIQRLRPRIDLMLQPPTSLRFRHPRHQRRRHVSEAVETASPHPPHISRLHFSDLNRSNHHHHHYYHFHNKHNISRTGAR